MAVTTAFFRFVALAGAIGLAACNEAGTPAAAQPRASTPTPACRSESFEDVPLTHCIADPTRHRVLMVLGRTAAAPYRSLAALAADRRGGTVAFAMNGGMFDDAGQPIGYYVASGKRLHRLNRAEGVGNFHLLPNGVFYGSDGRWEVKTTAEFARTVTRRPEFGTQSGPMLVIDGKLHPRISEDGASRYVRNAVGVDRQGRAHFVISDYPLSFGKLARYYRDVLKVPNALYLDGNVSALWNPEVDRIDSSPPLGPLIVVEKRASERE